MISRLEPEMVSGLFPMFYFVSIFKDEEKTTNEEFEDFILKEFAVIHQYKNNGRAICPPFPAFNSTL